MRCLGMTMFIITLGACSVQAEDTQINHHVSQDQKDVDLAFDANGVGVAVWNSYQQDGSSGGIFARRLSDTGQFLGDEIPINGLTEGNQAEPGVAMGAEGNLLVCWRGPGPLADSDDVFARLFDPNGVALTDDVFINEFVDNDQRNPRVAASDQGYIIVWESKGLFLDDGNWQVSARLLDTQGEPRGPEIRISDTETDCRNADIAIDGQGRFVVVWLEGKSGYHIKARTFDDTGVAEMASFRVDTVSPRSVTSPSVAIDDLGSYVIAWDGDPNKAADDDIHIRQFDPNSLPLGDQMTVNSTQQGAQRNPRIALSQSRICLVVWEHESSSDANGIDILGQYFDAANNPLGPEMQFNAHTADNQQDPAVCIFPSGQALTVWESSEQDGSSRGIFGNISPPCLSADLSPDGIISFLDFATLALDEQRANAALPDDFVGNEFALPDDLLLLCSQWVWEAEPGEGGE